MISLKTVTENERELLWNINQKYLYEMTNFYPDDMDELGNFHYGYFEEYFRDPKRNAYLIYENESLVGFAMLNPYSYIEHNPDHVMAEFGIFPSYRKRGLAKEAAQKILDKNPGKWEIKFNEKNAPAKHLWEGFTKKYSPKVYHLNEEETVLEFCTYA